MSHAPAAEFLFADVGQDETILYSTATFEDIRIARRVVAFTDDVGGTEFELWRK